MKKQFLTAKEKLHRWQRTKLLVLSCLLLASINALAYGQNKISINVKETEISTVLNTIEQQTVYRFLYNNDLTELNRRVSLKVEDAELSEVLRRLFRNTGLMYTVMDNNLITIKPTRAAKPAITVTGTVTAEDGRALSGVTVTVKGTVNGTSTDEQGRFSITVPDENSVLVFSSVGYTAQEIRVGTQTSISVSLASATSNLDNVVVVGYGTSRRREVTGSVASVRGAELAKQPVLTASQAVQGRVAGVQVLTNGDPNALPTIRVRGTGTLFGGANPLYVVDGIINDDIRNINTADIVSMDILKDASATAIYGMRAANGVVLITTKKGRAGGLRVGYDVSMGVKEATRLVDMAGPEQYANYINEANIYYGPGDSLITRQMLNNGANTDWYDEILKKGFFQNHNVSLSGGSDAITYFLSAGLVTDEGIIKTNNFKRFTLRSNNEYKISNAIRLSTLLSYSRTDVRGVDLSVFNVAYRAAPYVASKVGDKYGNTSLSNNVGNPLLDLEKRFDGGNGDRLQGNVALDIKPWRWLALRSSFGADRNVFNNRAYQYRFANTGDANVFLQAGGNQLRPNSVLDVANSEGTRWVWDNTATLTNKWGNHNFTLLLGTTAEEIKFSGITGRRLGVPEDQNQWYLNAGASSTALNNSIGDKNTRNSYLSRLNYNFNDRFFVTATMRADGSSRLPAQNRWGYFPSVGVGWDVTREGFMNSQTIFRTLKLRASWGRVGNDQIGSSLFRPLARQNLSYFFNGTEYLGIAFDQVSDPNLRWEVSKETNLGLDFSVIKGKLSGTLDFYSKKTVDALVSVNIPGILGDPDNTYITNAGTISNRGVELSLDWNQSINSNWRYNLNVNGAYNQNKIDQLNGGQALFDGNIGGSFTTKSDNGQPIGSFFLLEKVGIFRDAAEIARSAQTNARPGDIQYRDVNGDNVINDDDRVFFGSYQPKFTYGVNGGVSFKNIDLSFNTYGTAGGKIYNGKKAARPDGRDNIEASVARNRWTPNNPNSDVPRANLGQERASSYFLESGSFFRINNLTVGYTLSSGSLSALRIRSLRVFGSIQNLATFTSYSGFTPELLSSDANRSPVLAGGIESNIYPTTRTFVLGLNVGF
jgi:TonB-dependent starch-binding outer membrane protein SusC